MRQRASGAGGGGTPGAGAGAGCSWWRRLTARMVRALSELIAASEPKRRRPRNLYIRGMTARALVNRPYSE